MDTITAQKLTDLTTQFYAAVADSFSETRAHAWTGWQRVLDIADGEVRQPFRVLDVACGNMRFERFLARENVAVQQVCAVDNCLLLVKNGELDSHVVAEGGAGFPFPVDFWETDIVQNVCADSCASGDRAHRALFGERAHNFSVCFGFMHHLPQPDQRIDLLRQLIRATQAGGIVAVSFWQFAQSARLLRKAQETTERALAAHGIAFEDENDYLLGWKDEQNVFRYCHNYTEDEIDVLIAAVMHEGAASSSGASDGSCVREIARFSSDGAEENLNRYVILKVEGL